MGTLTKLIGDNGLPMQNNITDRSAKITTIGDADGSNQVHLEPRTQYEVQVRALNGEGDSTFAAAANWSSSARPTTGASNREAGLRQHVARRRHAAS